MFGTLTKQDFSMCPCKWIGDKSFTLNTVLISWERHWLEVMD